ncbi:hypothetical protein DdX_11893 [Ditylenchus destructor]|uniref:Uncharacterized protein n=1 Tax=Ditylenchus destructor TaxID=166010 RepID=A0AAD4R0Y0_9BILA|nr:hypothetical protein DdX_11893 [Ditylenchus destructor]
MGITPDDVAMTIMERVKRMLVLAIGDPSVIAAPEQTYFAYYLLGYKTVALRNVDISSLHTAYSVEISLLRRPQLRMWYNTSRGRR